MAFPGVLLNPNDEPIPDNFNCTEGVQWIWIVLRQCAISPREVIAVVFGFISVLVWIVFAIPQIIENFRKGIPDQALSPVMLTCFFVGDFINFIGCVFVHQLPLQIISAAIGVLSDIIQICQFLYYKFKHKVLLQQYSTPIVVSQADNPGSESGIWTTPTSSALAVVFIPFGFVFCLGSFWPIDSQVIDSYPTGSRRLLASNFTEAPDSQFFESLFPTRGLLFGYILGWISASIYISSRVSQIIKNWQRGSTEGLSPATFVFAIIGNVTYGLQILLTSVEANFIIRALPWLFGSLGVVLLDFVICSQFFLYRNHGYIPLEESVGADATAC